MSRQKLLEKEADPDNGHFQKVFKGVQAGTQQWSLCLLEPLWSEETGRLTQGSRATPQPPSPVTAGSWGTSRSRESEERVHISAAFAFLETGPAVSSCVQEASRSTLACRLWMQVRREARPDCWTVWGRGGGSGQALGVREPPEPPNQ